MLRGEQADNKRTTSAQKAGSSNGGTRLVRVRQSASYTGTLLACACTVTRSGTEAADLSAATSDSVMSRLSILRSTARSSARFIRSRRHAFVTFSEHLATTATTATGTATQAQEAQKRAERGHEWGGKGSSARCPT